MQLFPPTLILRHRRENLKKCSLRGLESRQDCFFLKYPIHEFPNLSGYIMLSLGAPELTIQDSNKGILLIDGTWRYAEKMIQFVEKHRVIEKRSLPLGIKTAYPRRQEDCSEPERGLASVEALYSAYKILGRDTKGILDLYHWSQEYLLINSRLLA